MLCEVIGLRGMSKKTILLTTVVVALIRRLTVHEQWQKFCLISYCHRIESRQDTVTEYNRGTELILGISTTLHGKLFGQCRTSQAGDFNESYHKESSIRR